MCHLRTKACGKPSLSRGFLQYGSKMCEANSLMRVDFISHSSTAQSLLLCLTCHGCAGRWGVVGEPCEIQT